MIPAIILAIENDEDREFMASVYLDLYPMMKSAAIKIVKEKAAAEDMVHDTIAVLIDKLDLIRDYERKRLVSYIMRAVRNISINYYNKHIKDGGRMFYGFEDEWIESIPDDMHSPSDRFELLEEYAELGNAVGKLSEREQEILYLKYNMGLKDQEIGDSMGISKDSVRTYLTRARGNAKKYLTKEGAAIE